MWGILFKINQNEKFSFHNLDFIMLGIIDLHAQEKDRHEFLVEVDPLPFIMGCVGGHLGWSPKKSEQV